MCSAPSLQIGCLVMAAGNASRFGKNKLAEALDGVTLIERALRAVPAEEFSRVCVVSQYAQIERLAERFHFLPIHNPHPAWGLSHTIRLGTEAMASCDGILYLVADQPLLRQESVRRVVETWRRAPEKIVGAACAGRFGNPNLFPKRYFPELLALTGEQGGSFVRKRHAEAYLPVELAAEELIDCDTEQALKALSAET